MNSNSNLTITDYTVSEDTCGQTQVTINNVPYVKITLGWE